MRSSLAVPLLLASALSLLVPDASPDEATAPELNADRPGFSESTEVVPPGSFQWEAGVLRDRAKDGESSTRRWVAPQPLLRLGLTSRVELRLGADGYVRQTVDTAGARESQGGLADLVLGAKIHLREARGWRPALALVPTVALPTGAAAFSSGGVDPQLKLDWSLDLPRGFGLNGSLALGSVSVEAGRQRTDSQSVGLGHSFPAELQAFLEVYRLGAAGQGGTWTLDGGLSRILGQRLQVDLSLGRTLTSGQDYWFVSAGVAVRHSLRSHGTARPRH
jgi:hypothetical protein